MEDGPRLLRTVALPKLSWLLDLAVSPALTVLQFPLSQPQALSIMAASHCNSLIWVDLSHLTFFSPDSGRIWRR